MDFKEQIKPFSWVELESSYSVCMYVGDYKPELFESQDVFPGEGNGYDWASLAQVFLDERFAGRKDVIHFDPEASMFCAYSKDADALRQFILGFKAACEDDALVLDLLSRAEPD
ncbi:MAG: hypothetical protein HFG20_10275 [Anaerotruncus sp.]|jgi:hypothetical protein|nr:hypothetical protein [Anaerotruncus sp.]